MTTGRILGLNLSGIGVTTDGILGVTVSGIGDTTEGTLGRLGLNLSGIGGGWRRREKWMKSKF